MKKLASCAYLDVIEVMVVALNLKGEVTLINRKGCEILGYKEKDILGKNWFDTFIPQGDSKKVKLAYNKLMKGKLKLTGYYENPVKTKSGVKIIVWYNSILKDLDGKIAGILSSGEDITERKKIEEELEKSEEKFKLIIEHSDELFYVHDVNNILSYVSPQCKAILGYSPEEMKINWTKLTTDNPLNIDGIKATENAIKTGLRQEVYTLELKRKDGVKIFVEINESPILDSDNNVVAISGALRDITSRKLISKKLEESSRQFRDLFDNAGDIIQSIDSRKNFIYVNKKWKNVLGYTEKEIKKLNFEQILRKDMIPHCRGLFVKLGKGESFENIDTVFISKTGKEIFVEGNINSKIENGKFIETTGIFRDVTKRRKVEAELKKRMEESEKLLSLSIDRELRMVEMKREVNDLLGQLGKKPKYKKNEND